MMAENNPNKTALDSEQVPAKTNLNLHGYFSYFLYDLAREIKLSTGQENPFVLIRNWNAATSAAGYLLVLTDIARNLSRLHDQVMDAQVALEDASISSRAKLREVHHVRQMPIDNNDGNSSSNHMQQPTRPSRFSTYMSTPSSSSTDPHTNPPQIHLYLARKTSETLDQLLEDKLETLSIIRTMLHDMSSDLGRGVLLEATVQVTRYTSEELGDELEQLERSVREQIDAMVAVWTTPAGEDCFRHDGEVRKGGGFADPGAGDGVNGF